MKYKRVLLKLSGESLMGSKTSNIDPAMLEQYSEEIKSIQEQGSRVGYRDWRWQYFQGRPG
jgi:uridylate kinase